MQAEFYDAINGAIKTAHEAITRYCAIQPCSNPQSLDDSEITRLTGWLPLFPFETPEGMVAVGEVRIVVISGAAHKWYSVITFVEHEAQRSSAEALQQAEAAQLAQTRILGLADAYGADIVIIGRLLAVFGLKYPCEVADATTIIKGGLASGQISLDLAPYADTLEARYKAVREAMTDDEIVAVAKILEARQ
jgi:hypothetical protein